ncbi:hypothetical protein LEL_05665 [Akanthomyces lecanii RCEF 1005]|uniref:Uncharacterized protein n=1 Tax=Akanthomyces lecanii RCEF 1005 TaxID=1081108 RepID=A0A168G3Q8_CORDF|nr:hypothetical protein LEL_05665 [Akanthomyces lecanii RCEF 1005]
MSAPHVGGNTSGILIFEDTKRHKDKTKSSTAESSERVSDDTDAPSKPTAASTHEDMPFLRQIFDPQTLTMQHYLNVGNNDGSLNENVPDSESAPDYSADPARGIGNTLALLPTEHTAILDKAIGAFTPDEDFEMLSLSAPSPIPALTEAG